ncbi:MAG: hypothetical protein NT150_07895, partial [Bacteroidetes bacterium]|nr:hypothetical protein [Bacteroidota bacterium]
KKSSVTEFDRTYTIYDSFDKITRVISWNSADGHGNVTDGTSTYCWDTKANSLADISCGKK